MTQSDIIRLAHEAGLHIATDHDWMPIIALAYAQKFAEVVRAEEREACAKVCDAECNPTPHEGHITTYQSGGYIMAEYLASAIRARGQG